MQAHNIRLVTISQSIALILAATRIHDYACGSRLIQIDFINTTKSDHWSRQQQNQVTS